MVIVNVNLAGNQNRLIRERNRTRALNGPQNSYTPPVDVCNSRRSYQYL